ncbi:MAG: hypothetical protein WCI02_08220 [Planctomycetota bacterium]
MPIFELPTDFARNPNRAGDMATFDFEISKDRIARIHGVAREARIGVHDWLLTIWSILLYRYTSCAGFVVSTSGCTTTARVDTLLDSLHASYDSLHFQLDPTHSTTFLAEAVSRCDAGRKPLNTKPLNTKPLNTKPLNTDMHSVAAATKDNL